MCCCFLAAVWRAGGRPQNNVKVFLFIKLALKEIVQLNLYTTHRSFDHVYEDCHTNVLKGTLEFERSPATFSVFAPQPLRPANNNGVVNVALLIFEDKKTIADTSNVEYFRRRNH